MLYFLSADDRTITATYEEIIKASKNCGRKLLLDVGHNEKVPCTMAALYSGYVTAVFENGSIVQDWAGFFTIE